MLLGRSTWIWLAGGGLFAAMAAAALYVAWPLLNPQIVATAPLDPQCDLRRGACTARLPDGGEVRLELDPKTLPLLEPLRIAVDVEGLRALGVEVDFAGVDMNMGYNRPALAAEGTGRFVGTTVLPVCVRHRMDWEARVLVRTPEGVVAAPYRFSTYRKAP
jgi:hypothetical protein